MSVSLWVVLALGLVVFFWCVGAYNRLVRLKNAIANAFGQIDVQLKRRYDLIPNLVETVKGYASHESETLEAVIAARNAGVSAETPGEQAQAENMISGALRQLFAVSEAYPDLKANQSFLNLQEELTATEDKIAYARQYYNDQVRTYNTRIQQFPPVVVANLFHFEAREFFEADEGDRDTPRVQF